jgi:ElaA protein
MTTMTTGNFSWQWLTFDEISTPLLYTLLQLRQEVFVIEQKCLFLDADGKDPACVHGFGFRNGPTGSELIAHARIVPPGLAYPELSIGRVVTAANARGGGLGRTLMTETLNECQRRFPNQPITIGAQLYLQNFYESFGFVVIGTPYSEDDIMHVDMTRA